MLENKVILITGVGGGIGTTILDHFCPKTKYVISSSRTGSLEDLRLLLSSSNTDIAHITHLPYDLTQEDNVIALFKYIKAHFGRLDVLINTIGGSLYSHPIEEFPVDEFLQVLTLNLTSCFLLTKEAIKLMKHNEPNGGNIVHIVSSSAKKFSKHKAPYGIAKAGQARLIQYAANEAAIYNIKINGVSPTYVLTPRHNQDIEKKISQTNSSKEEIIKNITSSQILKKPMVPEDLIPVVELLATTQVITGQIYNCTLGEVINY